MQGSATLKGGLLALAMAALTIPALAAGNAALQARVQDKLHSKTFEKVTVSTDAKGDVTLAGTVDKYQEKLDAEKKAKKADGVQDVDNQIAVAGKPVSDAQLEAALNRSLAYDRVGYGNVFDNIVATVKNGVVTLKGSARWAPDKSSALALVANHEGVKDVVDDVEVLPTSIYDDQLRASTVRAIYGNSVLSRYGMDPAAPIRVIVDRGHIALYGTVQSELDKNLAYMQARSVPGAFGVQNYLKVSRG